MSDERFPIQSSLRTIGKDLPTSVPWSVVEPHEKQALRNHGQTLKRLAERGGLGWMELEDILLDRSWDGRVFLLPKENAAYATAERAAGERVMKILS